MANKKTLRNLPIANVWFVISKYSSAAQFLYEKCISKVAVGEGHLEGHSTSSKMALFDRPCITSY